MPLGLGLLIAGLVVPRPLDLVAQQMPLRTVRALLFLGTDLFRLCFFAGLALLIIGALRNRRARRQP